MSELKVLSFADKIKAVLAPGDFKSNPCLML